MDHLSTILNPEEDLQVEVVGTGCRRATGARSNRAAIADPALPEVKRRWVEPSQAEGRGPQLGDGPHPSGQLPSQVVDLEKDSGRVG
ncbi:hypothetical protein [Pseudonocardia sp.]|jgi:hypothetical protein|uniref:hypothetical protein n=1 Tax=Pseudonocardia sp. TaxID=60912 RepID=UPI00262B09CB|nr:hypothetical protein [Pseudonocardia sp.]